MADFYDLPPLQDDSAKPGSVEFDIIQWAETRLTQGQNFLSSQIGYNMISIALDAVFANEKTTSASYAPVANRGLSRTSANLIAKIAEDLTAMLTDTRYFWNYQTNNPKYQKQAENSNKLAEQWYINRQIDLRIGDVVRYYTIAGTGVAHHYYSRQVNDMMLEAEDPRNVFPIDPISYHTFQDCKGVIVRRARTPDWVKEEFQKVVKSDTGGSSATGIFGWIQRNIIDGPGERGGPLSKRSKADTPIPATPTVFVNTMYLRDPRVNKTGKPVRMGPWAEVDAPGAMIPGVNDPVTGIAGTLIPGPKTKKWQAQTPWSYEVPAGAPLYPFHRMIVWGGGALLYDGPSPYWHAKFPLIKLTLNPWPNSWFGKAPLWDCLPLQNSINANLRVIDDHAAKVAQPAIIGDRNVSKAEMQKADSRAPGMKIRTNMASGKGISIVGPPPLDQLIWEIIKWSDDKIQKLSGVFDPSSMAALAQVPSNDTIDSMFKAMTPGVRLRSRILEGFYKDLSEMQLYGQFEWDTLSKRVAVLGPTAATPEDFDYAAGTSIPDDVPDGQPGDIAGAENALGIDSPRPLYQRCRVMLMSFMCKFDPSSLLNSANQQELAKYFMLSKMGACSFFTLWDKMGILGSCIPPGLSVPPDELGRLALQQQLGLGMIANAQGRKATNEAPPAIGQSGNGPTITTS